MTATPSSPQATAPRPQLTHREIVTILVGLMAGMFLAALDQTVVATAIRTIADHLHGLQHQAWATTAYLITSTIMTPLYGKLGDIYGRKPLFVTAIVVFITGSVLCTFAGSMAQLAVWRAVQGLGAGGLFVLALAIVGDIVPPRERARYQGFFLAVFGTSSVLGPVIGGLLAGQDTILGIDGWRWVFLVNVPVGIVALALVLRGLHLRHTRLDHRLDWPGALLLMAALVPLLLVAEQGREWGWTSGRAVACYLVGAVGFALFLVQEMRMGDEAITPLSLLRNKTVGISCVGSLLVGVAMFGGLALLPLYLQIVRGATPTEAGLMLLPMSLGIMAGSLIAGQLISRTGRYRHFPVIGGVLLLGALISFRWIDADTPLWQTMLLTVPFGLGLGFNFQPLTIAVQNAAERHQIGVATSTVTFSRSIGGTLGTAVFLSILFAQVPDRISHAMRQAAATPEFRAALRDPANAEFARQLAGGAHGGSSAGVLADSSFLGHLDPVLAHPFLVGFSDAMTPAFVIGAAIMVVATVVMTRLPKVELEEGPRARP